MSVQVLDTEIYNYIAAGIIRAAYETTINEYFNHEIFPYFKDKDIETETYRLVNVWQDLNVKSYCGKYKEKYSPEPTIKHAHINMKQTGIQFIKFIQSLYYQIEIEHFTPTAQELEDYKLLTKIKSAGLENLVNITPAWTAAKWS